MHTGYRLIIEPLSKRVEVKFNGVIIAGSDDVLVMHETRLSPVYYFPRADVRMDLMERTELQTYCPFKGNASYWTLTVAGKSAENAVWSYETPFDEAAVVRDYIAFYWDAMDSWSVAGAELSEAPQESVSTDNNPLFFWTIQEGWSSTSSADLVQKFCEALIEQGVPVWRCFVITQTLHPQLFGAIYYWYADRNRVEAYSGEHATLQKPAFQNSPIMPILRGEGGIRRKLEEPGVLLDYPILQDLKKEGVTDYVAMPMVFSDGQINMITLASKTKGGFSLAQLGHIHEILPALSRFFEVHTTRQNAVTLLDTYLGQRTGQRILDGKVKRGDGEDIHAVIWFSDLRNSTRLSESLPRAAYLETLNEYFECTAGAVMANGGEVLKFIGDAVLAIFPCGKNEAECNAVYNNVLNAARDTRARFAGLNQARRENNQEALEYGVALHEGMITYGNIGTTTRLDFTVIGAAVNEASRMQDKCKELGYSFLVSAAVARSLSAPLQSLGRHSLRGISRPLELFALMPEMLEQNDLLNNAKIA